MAGTTTLIINRSAGTSTGPVSSSVRVKIAYRSAANDNGLPSAWACPSRSKGTAAPSARAWRCWFCTARADRSEEHTSELQSRGHLVCRLLLEKKKMKGHTRLHQQAT